MDFVRVIPCLDMKQGRVVKGVHFLNLVDAADPVEAAEAYSHGGADEIAFLEKVAAVVDVPLTIGGGIKSLEDIAQALKSGASCVSISSAAYRDPEMVRAAVEKFGSEKIMVAIDADANDSCPSKREVYVDGGRTATGKDAVEFAEEMKDIGVGQILPTSKATDGTKDGYDIELTRAIADATGLPVIASGGAGKLEHFYDVVAEGHAAAVLAASVFHFGEFTIREVKQYLRARGVTIRL